MCQKQKLQLVLVYFLITWTFPCISGYPIRAKFFKGINSSVVISKCLNDCIQPLTLISYHQVELIWVRHIMVKEEMKKLMIMQYAYHLWPLSSHKTSQTLLSFDKMSTRLLAGGIKEHCMIGRIGYSRNNLSRSLLDDGKIVRMNGLSSQ